MRCGASYRVLFTIVLLLIFISCQSQNKIGGVVYSKMNRNPVGFVNVVVKSGNTVISGTNANESGQFEINLKDTLDSIKVELFLIDYNSTDTILKRQDFSKNIKLWLGGINEAGLLFDESIAKKDLENKIVKIYFLGLPAYSFKKMNKIAQEYGFQYEFLGCSEVSEEKLESVRRYNAVVMDHLSKTNSPNWKEDLMRKIKYQPSMEQLVE